VDRRDLRRAQRGDAWLGITAPVLLLRSTRSLRPKAWSDEVQRADIVLDVRFLPNPDFIPELRPPPGTTKPVSDWVLAHEVSQEFLRRATDLLAFLVPRYRDEGKAYLTVALGCTGGRHRSVALAEALGKSLAAHDVKGRVRHRDVERE
jgi:UPF0042 nucleotide-binding protein